MIFTGVQLSPTSSLLPYRSISKDVQPHILLVQSAKDLHTGLMRRLIQLFVCWGWKFRFIDTVDASNNFLESFDKARQRSACVLFVLTPNYDEEESFDDFLPMAIRNHRETPVYLISTEDYNTKRCEVGARRVIKYSSNSNMWEYSVFHSISELMGVNDNRTFNHGDIAGPLLPSPLYATGLFGKYRSNSSEYHGIMANKYKVVKKEVIFVLIYIIT